ncbi:MAG: hypothetical protein JSW67_00530 [Candidatus Latescibacterota bacterium]|nr:MAG: hypothetical protein JSW67_00530 [Candidatus Latescibacterota bacterium]
MDFGDLIWIFVGLIWLANIFRRIAAKTGEPPREASPRKSRPRRRSVPWVEPSPPEMPWELQPEEPDPEPERSAILDRLAAAVEAARAQELAARSAPAAAAEPELPPPAPAPAKQTQRASRRRSQRAPGPAQSLREHLAQPRSVREAFLLGEVLAPPLARRRRRERRL